MTATLTGLYVFPNPFPNPVAFCKWRCGICSFPTAARQGLPLDSFTHENVGTEARAAERCDGLESSFHEHGLGAVRGLVSKGAGQPACDWIRLDETASLPAHGFER